jgi:hypothetical protein
LNFISKTDLELWRRKSTTVTNNNSDKQQYSHIQPANCQRRARRFVLSSSLSSSSSPILRARRYVLSCLLHGFISALPSLRSFGPMDPTSCYCSSSFAADCDPLVHTVELIELIVFPSLETDGMYCRCLSSSTFADCDPLDHAGPSTPVIPFTVCTVEG